MALSQTRVSIRLEKRCCTRSSASSAVLTENTPMLDPPVAGFTMARFTFVLFKKLGDYFLMVCVIDFEHCRREGVKPVVFYKFIGIIFIKCTFAACGACSHIGNIIFFKKSLNSPIFSKLTMNNRKNDVDFFEELYE